MSGWLVIFLSIFSVFIFSSYILHFSFSLLILYFCGHPMVIIAHSLIIILALKRKSWQLSSYSRHEASVIKPCK